MAGTTINEQGGHEDALAYLRRKAWGAGLALLLALGAVGWRLWYLQVHEGSYYFGQAQQQALRPITIPASRGEILDSTGRVLAEDVPSFAATLSYTPHPPSPQEVALLAGILRLAPSQIEAAAAGLRTAAAAQPYAPTVLKTGLTPAQYTAIEQNLVDLPGVNVEDQPIRVYPGIPGDTDPGEEVAANILGYVKAGSVSGEVTGAAGIEQTFNTLNPSLHTPAAGLAGVDGKELVTIDTSGHPVKQVAVQEPVPGNNVVLTIDAGLQAVAQRALEAQLVALRTKTFTGDGGPYPGAYWGAAVAIDVHTGAILALASVPTINPNAFAQDAIALPGSAAAASFASQFQAWQGDTLGQPFLDHATQSAFAPGSTFKPITAIAALEAGVLTPTTHLPCPTAITVGNTVLHNWISVFGGNLDLEEAIGRSCDTFFYQVGQMVGVNAIDQVAQEFGLGQATGLWELPGEAVGTVSSPAAYQTVYGLPWNLDLTMQTAIGQGMNAYTVIQMADYIAALANGGTLYTPYLVSEVTDGRTGKVVWKQQPEVRRRIGLTPEIVQAIHQAMASVTQCNSAWWADAIDSDCGTAYWTYYGFTSETQQYLGHAITVAGKTGTAQVAVTGNPNGWWVSFAPANNPQIAIVVETEKSGDGFVGGAPIAREMYDYYFGLDKAMFDAGAADQIIPGVVQEYFGLPADQHYPDWWGPAPAKPAQGSAPSAGAAQHGSATYAGTAPGGATAGATPGGGAPGTAPGGGATAAAGKGPAASGGAAAG